MSQFENPHGIYILWISLLQGHGRSPLIDWADKRQPNPSLEVYCINSICTTAFYQWYTLNLYLHRALIHRLDGWGRVVVHNQSDIQSKFGSLIIITTIPESPIAWLCTYLQRRQTGRSKHPTSNQICKSLCGIPALIDMSRLFPLEAKTVQRPQTEQIKNQAIQEHHQNRQKDG